MGGNLLLAMEAYGRDSAWHMHKKAPHRSRSTAGSSDSVVGGWLDPAVSPVASLGGTPRSSNTSRLCCCPYRSCRATSGPQTLSPVGLHGLKRRARGPRLQVKCL